MALYKYVYDYDYDLQPSGQGNVQLLSVFVTVDQPCDAEMSCLVIATFGYPCYLTSYMRWPLFRFRSYFTY